MENIIGIMKRNRFRKGKEESGFIQLFISKRLIHGAATALLGIFVPIFIYETTGQHFYIVGGYYALLSLLYVLFLVPGMKFINKLGFSRSLIVGGLASVLIYSFMFFMTPENFWVILPFLTVSIIVFRIFHWVPYHVDFAMFTKAGERGRQVSLSFATIAFMGVIGPIMAGFIIKHAGYNALFGTAVILLMAATVSYSFVPETNTRFTWTYAQTIKKIFSKNLKGISLGEFANGAEVAFTLYVWPIFLYRLLDGDVFEIGALSTVIVAVTIVLQIFVGKYLDKKGDNKIKTLKTGSVLYALGWILKIFIFSAAQVFFVGLYHNIVKIFTKTPFTAIIYDMSADQGRYVDEFTVVREMTGHTGRAVSLIVISLLSLTMPIEWTFVLAAGASIALNMVYATR